MIRATALAFLLSVLYGFVQTRPSLGYAGAVAAWFLFSVLCGTVFPSNPLPSLAVLLGTGLLVALFMTLSPLGFLAQARAFFRLGRQSG